MSRNIGLNCTTFTGIDGVYIGLKFSEQTLSQVKLTKKKIVSDVKSQYTIFDPLMYYMFRCHLFLLSDIHLVYSISVSDLLNMYYCLIS